MHQSILTAEQVALYAPGFVPAHQPPKTLVPTRGEKPVLDIVPVHFAPGRVPDDPAERLFLASDYMAQQPDGTVFVAKIYRRIPPTDTETDGAGTHGGSTGSNLRTPRRTLRMLKRESQMAATAQRPRQQPDGTWSLPAHLCEVVAMRTEPVPDPEQPDSFTWMFVMAYHPTSLRRHLFDSVEALVGGEGLPDWLPQLARHARAEVVLQIILDVLDGYHAVQSALPASIETDFAWRDCKPENLLVDSDPVRRMPRRLIRPVLMTDFETSTLVEVDPTGTLTTTTANAIATRPYLSPQAAVSLMRRDQTPRGDMWALGVTALHLWAHPSVIGDGLPPNPFSRFLAADELVEVLPEPGSDGRRAAFPLNANGVPPKRKALDDERHRRLLTTMPSHLRVVVASCLTAGPDGEDDPRPDPAQLREFVAEVLGAIDEHSVRVERTGPITAGGITAHQGPRVKGLSDRRHVSPHGTEPTPASLGPWHDDDENRLSAATHYLNGAHLTARQATDLEAFLAVVSDCLGSPFDHPLGLDQSLTRTPPPPYAALANIEALAGTAAAAWLRANLLPNPDESATP